MVLCVFLPHCVFFLLVVLCFFFFIICVKRAAVRISISKATWVGLELTGWLTALPSAVDTTRLSAAADTDSRLSIASVCPSCPFSFSSAPQPCLGSPTLCWPPLRGAARYTVSIYNTAVFDHTRSRSLNFAVKRFLTKMFKYSVSELVNECRQFSYLVK